jgi:dnd system-associated protein 4
MMARLRSIVRSKAHEEMVQTLARESVDGKPTVFRTIRELLCFSAMLGFQMGKKVPLADTARGEDVMIEEFDRNESVDLIYLVAVADTGGTEILKSDSDVDMVTIFEEYVNGGFDILKGWLHQYRDPIGFQAILQGLKANGFIDDETADVQTIMDSFKF